MGPTGNEPDLYSNNGLRSRSYNVQDYVADWINISTPVAQAIQSHPLSRRAALPPAVSESRSDSATGQGKRDANAVQGSVHIQACSFAGQGFTPTEVFGLGLLNSTPGELVSVYVPRLSAIFSQLINKPTIIESLSIATAQHSAKEATFRWCLSCRRLPSAGI